ncbi:MAG: hypothetical protein JJE04_14150 [Acidobacteriia bacterium]|nr:hypothetical protein [Terriglobia bacterium]
MDNLNTIGSLHDLVDSKTNLSMPQAVALFATALDFRPDTIIELGRGAGNSTAVFAQAASILAGLKVHSFCISNAWHDETIPKLEGMVSKEWLGRIVEYNQDLTQYDFSGILNESQRVLLFWDAHGFEIAEHVLAHIMPLIQDKPHLILCHDISDRRLLPDKNMDYEGKRPWRGMTDYYDQPDEFARLYIEWADTIVDQVLPIFDFCIRNKISLHSADYEYREGLANDPVDSEEVFRMLPCIATDSKFHYGWFTLNESSGPRRFPRRRANYQEPARQIEGHPSI